MNQQSRIRTMRLKRTTQLLTAVLMAFVMLAACRGNFREVTDQPPQVSLDGLERTPEGVIVALGLRNVNDEPLQLDGASVTIELDNELLGSSDRQLPLVIASRGREVLRLSLSARPAGLQRLDALAVGDVARLPWSLEARLNLSESGNRETSAEGWLHRVPGQPDRFR